MSDESGFQVPEHAPRHYQEQVQYFMVPFVDAIVATSVSRGDAVLDVACGTGFATRSAARAVGPAGRVVGSDINAGMVAMARSVPWESEPDISWSEASALDLPFADDEFDAVICQQGAQFFPDVSAGLAEMARVTRPGGRVAATIWAGIDHSPFFTTEFEMLVRFCGTDPDALGGTFVEGGEGQIRDWFARAGLDEFSIEYLERDVSLPPVAEYVPEHLKALPWSGGFFELSTQERAEATAWMEDKLSDHRTDEGIEVPFRSYLATTTI
jgi:ubiquinone/menaquinone biosynthesis C-methylase UbiE